MFSIYSVSTAPNVSKQMLACYFLLKMVFSSHCYQVLAQKEAVSVL